MPYAAFHEETIKVIRHLQRRLITIIDKAHSPEILKEAVVEYLESLLRAGPHYMDVEEHMPPARRKDPPPRVPDAFFPFTGRDPRDLTQKIVSNTGLNQFSSPSDRETVFHGIRIPPGCDVLELPSIRPHVRDFFFVEGNVRHFVSVDERPTSENSPSDRVIFHSTCPQSNNSRNSSTNLKGYRLHKPYIAVCPLDDRDYSVEVDASANHTPQDGGARERTTLPCRKLNDNNLKKALNIPEISRCDRGQNVRYPTTNSSDDTRHIHDERYRHNTNILKVEPDFSESNQHYVSDVSASYECTNHHHASCNHWPCNLRNAIGSQAETHSRKIDVQLLPGEKLQNGSSDLLPKIEQVSDCPTNKTDLTGLNLANVQVKAEESVSNYEKKLRQKYDTQVPVQDPESEVKCSHRHSSSKRHAKEVADFEKKLNEKYCTKHTCGKENSRDSKPLAKCDYVEQVNTNTAPPSQLVERIRAINEDNRPNFNNDERDSLSESIGDETFMERMLRVDPIRSSMDSNE